MGSKKIKPMLNNTSEQVLQDLQRHYKYTLGRFDRSPNLDYMLPATSYTVRDRLMERWSLTAENEHRETPRRVFYLSLEFLLGRSLSNAILNLDMDDSTRKALMEFGCSLESVEEKEKDAGLGNGGLGRLAACFMDSCASLGLPVVGYGIRYEYGMFHQSLRSGRQVEQPDHWLIEGNPWEIERPGHTRTVKFYGYTLRLWKAAATEEFNLQEFNAGDYSDAVAQKNLAEQITMVLYPNDSSESGKELRLRQQYFLASASIQDVIAEWVAKRGSNFHEFANYHCFQLNDTHPTLAVAELMRQLLDEHGLSWESAWEITSKTMAYTNHTLLPEALEKWSVRLMQELLPRLLDIIYEINARFLAVVAHRWPGDTERQQRMSIIEEGSEPLVRMAYLGIVGSFSVNGVAGLHSQLLTTGLFRDFYELWPKKFNRFKFATYGNNWRFLDQRFISIRKNSRVCRGQFFL